MPNSHYNPKSTNALLTEELLYAILAIQTDGNATQSEKLNDILNTLPAGYSNHITQSILKYNVTTNLKNLLESEPNENGKDRFLLHTAAEALLPQPPIDWLVKSLFSTGTVSLVVGNPGSKKTYSMMDLAVCLAYGKSWLGFETKPVPVLLIDEESGTQRLNRRLGDVMRGHSADGTIPLQYISLARFNFRPNGMVESTDLIKLEEKIRETKAKFILIDALADIMPGADENSVKDVQPIFMGLRQVADNTESAIVMIHHSNKTGGYRGSSAMLGAIDLMLMVESQPESPNIDFKVEKSRDDKPSNFAAVGHFEEGQFYLSSSQFTPKQTLSAAQRYVLKYLMSNGPSLVTIIKSKADICSETSAQKAVFALAHMNLIARVDGGVAGQKATYDLTESGKEKGKTCQ